MVMAAGTCDQLLSREPQERRDHAESVPDTLNGLMALPNLIALVVLAGLVVRLTRGFLGGQTYTAPEEHYRPDG